jgi:uncharacterized membrane protein
VRRRCQEDRGAVLLLTAVVLPVLLLMTAFAVDLGAQRASRRTMQARADVISLDLSRLIDGTKLGTIRQAASTEQAIVASAGRNGIDRSKLTVEWGTGTTGATFHALRPVLDDLIPPTAVRVTAAERVPTFFRAGVRRTSRSAVSVASGGACFEVGSKLLSVDTQQANLLNGLATSVLHTNVALNVATYQGLVGSTVNLGQLATQLGFASPSELANATVGAKDFYLAAANVLQANGYTAAAGVFNQMALATNQAVKLPVASLLQVDAGGATSPAAAAGLDAFNLLTGSLFAINGSSAISIPAVTLGIPNAASTTISVNVIQSPQATCGNVGASIKTSQVSVTMTTAVPGFNILGLLTVSGSVSLTTAVAQSTGTLTAIDCGTTKSISVGVTPQAVSVTLAPNLDIKAILGILPIARAATSLSVSPTGVSNGGTFLYPNQFLPPVGTGTMLAASTSPLGLNGLITLGPTELTLLGVLPLGTTLGGIANAINTNLLSGASGLLAKLDTFVTGPLSKALGLDVGGADIGALSMTCQNPRLVG